MTATDRETIYKAISTYIQDNFLDDEDVPELTADAPLLEWGVLTSMNTSLLLAFIRNELRVVVPPTHLTGQHFGNLRSITDTVHKLAHPSA
ncbi:acyl carrier protein [Streptomyces litchfieldiae]|uniref:Acyl carrier protein n=1 Tax=Streptomyces litchfieldiae TaxID=3075543 RepID=A0ABU2N067_9ACTN|nr:acyl carrier protein [Streptomyces sp. DSM 44938]MDT0346918.1 acyl carrier protein [Streptomyces sp. DSM 44938]